MAFNCFPMDSNLIHGGSDVECQLKDRFDHISISLHITRAWSLDYVKLRNIGQQFLRSIEMDFAE